MRGVLGHAAGGGTIRTALATTAARRPLPPKQPAVATLAAAGLAAASGAAVPTAVDAATSALATCPALAASQSSPAVIPAHRVLSPARKLRVRTACLPRLQLD